MHAYYGPVPARNEVRLIRGGWAVQVKVFHDSIMTDALAIASALDGLKRLNSRAIDNELVDGALAAVFLLVSPFCMLSM